MILPFFKLSGAGNDFILLERRPGLKNLAFLARRLCDRRDGIEADGLLVMERRRRGARLAYLNADGSTAFCGNGARCAALWAHRRGWAGRSLSLETSKGLVCARILGAERASILMPRPRSIRLGLRISAAGRAWTMHALDTGVPHAVVEVRGLDNFPVPELGRALRRHRAFAPAGANVDFISASRGVVSMRTYERGVEDETLACGTGAVAAALVACLLGRAHPPVSVRARGGTLKVSFSQAPDGPKDVWLEGPARVVFTGKISV